MTDTAAEERTSPDYTAQPIVEAEGMVKLFGRVVGLRGVDLRLFPGEVLAVIGDNGAGKSTLIKCLSGAMIPDRGSLKVASESVSFKSTAEARVAGIETVYQTLAVAPALDIASNLYLAREIRRPAWRDRCCGCSIPRRCAPTPRSTSRVSASRRCRTSTSRSRPSPAPAPDRGNRPHRAFRSKVAILDEPTAALGVRETAQVLRLVRIFVTRASV